MEYRIKEPVLTCPYEPTHQILPHRMAQHIIKCRKNHPELDMKTCDFNATHVVPSQDYQDHILACPTKAIVERDIYRHQDVEDAMEIKKREWVALHSESVGEEDWDKDCSGGYFNFTETMITKQITRPPPPGMMGKAGRRKWRKEDCERVRCINEGIHVDPEMYPDTSIKRSTTSLDTDGSFFFFGGQSSVLESKLTERDVKYSLTASKCNLAMRADQPLRRPLLLKNSRIAANIYGDSQTVHMKTSHSIVVVVA